MSLWASFFLSFFIVFGVLTVCLCGRERCVYLVLVCLGFVSLLIAANEMSGRLCVSGLSTCLYYPKVSLSGHLVCPLTLALLHMGNQCAPPTQGAPRLFIIRAASMPAFSKG